MTNPNYALVSVLLLLLLVGGASAATFVINGNNAALSLAANPNGEVAFSVVAAEEPGSFSATMGADDSASASATQASSIGDAAFIFSASAGMSPDGDYAYTFSETWSKPENPEPGPIIPGPEPVDPGEPKTWSVTAERLTETSQGGQAGQGNSASAWQETTSAALLGYSVVNGTDSHGSTASESVGFNNGVVDEKLSAATTNSASATSSGSMESLYPLEDCCCTPGSSLPANTLGIARGNNGDVAYTLAEIVDGTLDFSNGVEADDAKASASQSGAMSATYGTIQGDATSGNDHSWTLASVVLESFFVPGTMTFDSTAHTGSSTYADQDIALSGLTGAATAGSLDGTNYNYAQVQAWFGPTVLQPRPPREPPVLTEDPGMPEKEAALALRGMEMEQATNTGSGAYADQTGTISISAPTGTAWTDATARALSGFRETQVGTMAPGPVVVTVSQSLASSHENLVKAYEDKTRSDGSPWSTTVADARNLFSASSDEYSDVNTNTVARAEAPDTTPPFGQVTSS
jgi:hypothetical protein